jgi:hypothetical protein
MTRFNGAALISTWPVGRNCARGCCASGGLGFRTATSNCGGGGGGIRVARSGAFGVNAAVTVSTTSEGTLMSFGSRIRPSFSKAA